MNQKFKDVEALIRLFEQSNWQEISVEAEGLSVVLSKDPNAPYRISNQRGAFDSAPRAAMSTPTSAPTPPPTLSPAPSEAVPTGWVVVRAPNLGTFYRAPKPGAEPYVELDQTITADTEICLIEVMKLFTPVKAGIAGRIARICVEDGKMVEYDAPLFFIEPVA